MTERNAEVRTFDWPAEAVYRHPSEVAQEEGEPSPCRPTSYRGSDGRALAMLEWEPPQGVPVRGACVVLHGVQSHAGWYHRMGCTLARAGYLALFPDRRGSGANLDDRGHARSAAQLIDDIAGVLDAVPGKAVHGSSRLPTALAGISWGGKLAVCAAARWPSLVDALALICPGLTPRVGVPRRKRLAVALSVLTGRSARAKFAIPLADAALFTAMPHAQRFITQDPLSLRQGTAGLMASSFFLDHRVRRSLARVSCPVLLQLAGRDRIVNNLRTRTCLNRMPSSRKTVIEYPEGHHTLEFEPDPDAYLRDLAGWLDSEFSPGSSAP